MCITMVFSVYGIVYEKITRGSYIARYPQWNTVGLYSEFKV